MTDTHGFEAAPCACCPRPEICDCPCATCTAGRLLRCVSDDDIEDQWDTCMVYEPCEEDEDEDQDDNQVRRCPNCKCVMDSNEGWGAYCGRRCALSTFYDS